MTFVAITLIAGGIYLLVFTSKPKNIAVRPRWNVRLLKICGILMILCGAVVAVAVYMTRQ